MLLPQAVEDVGGIQTCIVAELPGDDLQSLGKGVDEQLRLASNGARMIPQVPAQPPGSSPPTVNRSNGLHLWRGKYVQNRVVSRCQAGVELCLSDFFSSSRTAWAFQIELASEANAVFAKLTNVCCDILRQPPRMRLNQLEGETGYDRFAIARSRSARLPSWAIGAFQAF